MKLEESSNIDLAVSYRSRAAPFGHKMRDVTLSFVGLVVCAREEDIIYVNLLIF